MNSIRTSAEKTIMKNKFNIFLLVIGSLTSFSTSLAHADAGTFWDVYQCQRNGCIWQEQPWGACVCPTPRQYPWDITNPDPTDPSSAPASN